MVQHDIFTKGKKVTQDPNAWRESTALCLAGGSSLLFLGRAQAFISSLDLSEWWKFLLVVVTSCLVGYTVNVSIQDAHQSKQGMATYRLANTRVRHVTASQAGAVALICAGLFFESYFYAALLFFIVGALLWYWMLRKENGRLFLDDI